MQPLFFHFTPRSRKKGSLCFKTVVLFCFCSFFSLKSFSQVATVTLDLSASTDTTIEISDAPARSGQTCGVSGQGNVNCIVFNVTLNPKSDQISFDIIGASGLGSASYQVNCGTPANLNTPICLNGITTASISFCKNGNNNYTYKITASTLVKGSADITLRQNCTGTMSVSGLQASTVNWTSVFPGTAGQYNNYLSCTSGCASTNVTPLAGSPAYIDYRVYGSSTSCGTAKDDTIRVYTTPGLSVPVTPLNPAICSGSSVVLTASPSGGNPPYAYSWSNGSTIATTNISIAGTYTVTVSDNTTGCAPVATSATVIQAPTPAAPTATGASICAGNSATLTATAPGGTYQWYDAATGGNLLFTGASFTTPLLSSSTDYYVETTVSSCPSSRTRVTVTVNPIPAAPAVNGATICAGNTAVLTATAPGGTYDWYNAATGGNLLTTATSYTTPVLNSSTNYYIQTTVAGCTSSRTQANVTVNPIPASPTAASVGICPGNTATLTATAPGGTYQWYDAATAGNLLITAASFTTPVLNTSTTYYVQTTVAGCTSNSRTAATVTITSSPALPTAADAAICVGTTATLTATSPGGTYDWYAVPSGGTSLFSGASFTTVSLNSSATYYVSVTQSGCPSSGRSAVNVTVSPIPATPTVNGTTVCAGNTASLTATAPGGTYDWYDAASGGTLLTSAANYTTPVLNSTTSYYIQTTIAGCSSNRTQATVTVNPIPAAPTAAPATICSGNTASLNATAPGGIYQWYDAAVGGSLVFTGNNFTTPVLTASTTYFLQTTVNSCTSTSRTPVAVAVTPIPAAPTTAAATICTGTTAALTATAPGGIYQWYDAAAGGSLVFTGNNFTTPVLTASTTYYVQSTINGCTGNRTSVTVAVNAIPVAPSVNGATICAGNTTTLMATAPGGVYQWYDAVSGGNLLNTGSSYITTVLNNSTDFYIQTSIAGCTSSRTKATVTVNPIPATPTVIPVTICAGNAATLRATAPGGTYEWFDAGSGGTLLATNPNYITPVLTNTATYYVRTTVAGCTSVRSPVSVTVTPLPAAPSVTNQTICAGAAATFTATAPGGAYEWYDAASGGNLLASTSNFTTGTLNTGTSFYVQTTVAGCAGPRTTASVTVNPVPAQPAVASSTICAGNGTTLTATAPGGVYEWYDAATGGTLLNTGTVFTTPAITNTTSYYVQTTVSGCTSLRKTVTVTATPIPVKPTVTGSSICAGSAASLTATAPGGTYQWYDAVSGGNLLATGTGFITPALSVSTDYFVQTTVSGCTSQRTSVSVTVTPIPAKPTVGGASVCAGNAATLMATAPGGTYQWYDAVSGGRLLTTNAGYTTGILDNSTDFYVQATIAGCTGPRETVTVTVTPIPEAPSVNTTTICEGNTTQLNATAPGGTYEWYDTAIGGNPLFTGSSFTTPVLTATKNYYVQSTIAGCTGSRKLTTVTVIAKQIPAFDYSSGTFCISGTDPTPALLGPGNGVFTVNPAGLIFKNNSTGEINLAASQLGTYTIQYTTGGFCVYSSTAKVTITNTPNAAFSYNSPFCQQQGVALADFVNGASAGIFSSNNSGLQFVSNSTGEIDLKKSLPGTYTITNNIAAAGGCAATSANTSVVINQAPVVDAGANQTVCAGTAAQLSGSIGGSATKATWSGGNGSFANSGQLNTTYTPAAGEKSVKVFLTSDDPVGSCVPVLDSVLIYFTPLPDTPTVLSTSVCTGGIATLIATGPGGIYQWYDASGSNLLASSNSYTTPALNTSTDFYVQAAMNGCKGPKKQITVAVTPKPVINSVSAGATCSGVPFSYPVHSSVSGSSYSWLTNPVAGISNQQLSGYTTDSLFVNLLSNSRSPVNITYLIIPQKGNCIGDTFPYVLTVNPIPDTPVVNSSSPACVGTTLFLTTAPVTGATYQWSGPDNFSSAVQNPVLNNITTASAGDYSLIITVNGCSSGPGIKNVFPVIAAPVARSNEPLCLGADLHLTADTIANAVYQWSGPGGFNSALQNPIVQAVNPVNAGTYYVTAFVAGCQGLTDSAKIIVNIPPSDPTVSSNSPVCTTDSIQLSASSVQGAGFQWTGPNGFNSQLASPVISRANTTNQGTYSVSASTPGCPNSNARSINVIVKQTPAIPVAGNNGPLCEGDQLNLLTPDISGAGFQWTGPSGFSSTQQNPVISQATVLNTGKYYITATLNGCKSDTGFTDILITTHAIADAGSDISVCANNPNVLLTGKITGGDTKTGVWSSNGSGKFLPSATQLSAAYNPSAADTAKGLVTLTLTTSNNLYCPVSADSKSVIISPAPTAFAGPDQLICINDSLVSLQGKITTALGGVWRSNGSGIFSGTDSLLNSIYIPSKADLQNGTVNFYLVTTGNNNCLAVTDTSSVIFIAPPYVNAGPDLIMFENETLLLTAQVNDSNLTYLWLPDINLSNNAIKNPVLSGKNNETYTVKVTGITGCTASDDVFVRVLKPITIPNIFSPNGDGIYDTWVIPSLANYPGATVQIFTRTGQKIFSSEGYDKPWDGTFNGKPVPVATYYYVIDPKLIPKIFSGSVTVVR